VPTPASSGGTADNVTTTQVLNTDTCAVGDTLFIAYGTDAFDLASMPEATSDAGALTPVDVVDLGTNAGHIKRYLVKCTTPGIKQITYPAHSGCDVHGHWIRIPEPCVVDVPPAQNVVTTNTTSSHVAPSLDPNGTDRLLICTWLTSNGPTFGEDPYVLPGGMTRRAETEASPFSDMCTATEPVPLDAPTGTRTATWLNNARYAAASVLLAPESPGGAVTGTLTLAGSAAGTQTYAGAVTNGIVLFTTATGSVGGGAPVSDVLCGPWATLTDLSAAQRTALSTLTDEEVAAALMRASEILWALSGRRWYGQGCTETATLRSHPPQPGQGTWPYHRMWGACACWGSGVLVDGRLFPGFADYQGEHIASPMAVKLPRSRVNSIVSVTIDGAPFAAYRLLQSGWVERTDGQGWRMCDDSTVIVYTFGEAPPAGGRDAAVDLGVELAKARIGDRSCRLPQRVTSVTRQGLSFSQIDPFTFLDKGRTGLLLVDLWLAAVNPEARPQAAGVWSPDIPGTIRS
jgi:hypothetical protein